MPPKSIDEILSSLESQRNVRPLDRETSRINCRLSPRKATLYEVKSWDRCHLILFLPSCNIYFMFASVCSDARKISTLTILRQKSVEASVNNSFNTLPRVVNSSFHIFPRSASLDPGSEWTCQEARPTPSPDSGPAFLKCSFCRRSEVAAPWLPWWGRPSAAHRGRCAHLDASKPPGPALLQLPLVTWPCTCLGGISFLTLLLLPHRLSDSKYLQTPSLTWRHSWPRPVLSWLYTLTIQSQDSQGMCPVFLFF